MNVLNIALYQALFRRIGPVRVTNPGERLVVRYVPDWQHKGRLRTIIDAYGETYVICCPFCGDTRFRLVINHSWARRDPRTNDSNLHLAKCFNEDCLNTQHQQRVLHTMVYPDPKFLLPHTLPESQVPLLAPRVDHRLPGDAQTARILPEGVPLDQLDDEHPARVYLADRGFDPDVIASEYGVLYCEKSNMSKPRITAPRLIIPIKALGRRQRPELVGWQSRLIGPPSRSQPKYLTAAGFRKAQHLYNLNRASQGAGPVVLVEGITDAWRVGPHAVAMLGKSLSAAQLELLLTVCRQRTLLVWLDRDADTESLAVVERIREARAQQHQGGRVDRLQCPPHRQDPGECTPAEIEAALHPFQSPAGRRGQVDVTSPSSTTIPVADSTS